MKLQFLEVYDNDANGKMFKILIGVDKVRSIQGCNEKEYKSYLSVGKNAHYYCNFTVQELLEKCNIEVVL